MLDDDSKRATYLALVDSVLKGKGRTSAELRAAAFHDDVTAEPLRTLIHRVAVSPARITEADFGRAKAAGFSEDELFEVVVCAALGQAGRLYDAGLVVLAEATEEGGAADAT